MTVPAVGLVLAGGQSRRMGGGDKGFRLLGGRPILAHVIARLRPQCATLLLSANGDPARFAPFGLPVVADDLPGFAGPLAGLLAGLDRAAREHPAVPDVLSVAADTPFLPPDLLFRLSAARTDAGLPIACAASGGRTHPAMALWPVALRHELRHALAEEGERRIGRFAARHGVALVEWPAEPVDPFFNVNEPGDLAEAERLWARLEAPAPSFRGAAGEPGTHTR